GKDEFLQPYNAARARLDENLARLRRLTADNQSQQARLRKLEGLIAGKRSLLEEGLGLRRKNEQEARALVATGQGKVQMDAIRALVNEMEQEEHTLLQERQRRSNTAFRVAVTTGLLATALGLALVGAFVWLLDRSLRVRQRSAALVHEQHELFRTTLASI